MSCLLVCRRDPVLAARGPPAVRAQLRRRLRLEARRGLPPVSARAVHEDPERARELSGERLAIAELRRARPRAEASPPLALGASLGRWRARARLGPQGRLAARRPPVRVRIRLSHTCKHLASCVHDLLFI